MTKQEKALGLIETYTRKIDDVKERFLDGKHSEAQMSNDIRRYTVEIRRLCEMIKTGNYFI